RGLVDKAAALFVRSNQRLDFAAQLLVARARLRDEQAALVRAIRDRRVEDFLNLLPALRCHSQSLYKIPGFCRIYMLVLNKSCQSCLTFTPNIDAYVL